jgi:hypothetical protein
MRPAHAKLMLGGAMLALLTAAAGLERCPQVIGFASAPQMNASVTAPTLVRSLSTGYQLQQVVFHAPMNHATGDSVRNRAADLSLKASRAHSVAARDRIASVALKLVPRPRQPRAVNVSDVRSSGQRQSADASVLQWVLVTSWQREDGERVVLTSARMSDGGVPVAMTQVVGQLPTVQDQFHPYAAVPVRGGWLVFQL